MVFVGCFYMLGTVIDVIMGEFIISVDVFYGWIVERQGIVKV